MPPTSLPRFTTRQRPSSDTERGGLAGGKGGGALDDAGQAAVTAGAPLEGGPVSAGQHRVEQFGNRVRVARLVKCVSDVLEQRGRDRRGGYGQFGTRIEQDVVQPRPAGPPGG